MPADFACIYNINSNFLNNIINYEKNAIKAFDFVTIRDIMIRTIIEKCLSVVIHDKKGLFLWLKKQKK